MKIYSKTIKSIAVLLGFVALLASCTEDNSNPMEENIKDVSNYITAVDKEIASPGDEVTITGTNLDKVYKIMLNDNLTVIEFEATETSLTFIVPSSAPLGDVVIINIFFEGKGLARYPIEIISPPVISGFSPIAATGGEECHVYGTELYKAVEVYVGDTEVSFTLIDDKHFVIDQLPEIENGDQIKVVDAAGSETISDWEFVRGTEILITDFDSESDYYTELSSNGNLDGDTEEKGPLPYGTFYTFVFTDNGTSWGGNLDFYFEGVPANYPDNSKVWLYIDIKMSDPVRGRIMVQDPANVYGDDRDFTTEWTTFKLRLDQLYTGYGNGDEVGACPTVDKLTAVKVQPPASADANNFGKTISVDNIRFVVEE
jgi:hypothetical protein